MEDNIGKISIEEKGGAAPQAIQNLKAMKKNLKI